MEKPRVRISVRNLVEFILRSGDLDNSSGTSGDKEAMLKGGRLHRKIQRSMKGDYQAEVSLKKESEYDDVVIQVEGRADGIFTEDGAVYIDEIKGTYGNVQAMDIPVAVHRAQAMCYGLGKNRFIIINLSNAYLKFGKSCCKQTLYCHSQNLCICFR